jgi:hypothetical protein
MRFVSKTPYPDTAAAMHSAAILKSKYIPNQITSLRAKARPDVCLTPMLMCQSLHRYHCIVARYTELSNS